MGGCHGRGGFVVFAQTHGRPSRMTPDHARAGTRVSSLPGCGHVPMSDDPDAVAGLITESARV